METERGKNGCSRKARIDKKNEEGATATRYAVAQYSFLFPLYLLSRKVQFLLFLLFVEARGWEVFEMARQLRSRPQYFPKQEGAFKT